MSEHPALAGIGAVLILAIAYDSARTTLSASSSGPLTARLASLAWLVLLRYHQHRHHHRLLGAAGTWITLLLIFFWVSTTWLGWFLLFCSWPEAVVDATTQMTVGIVERAYFIGYTITTLGYGGYVPGTGVWQILATLAAGNGLLLFTLSITYAIPIISAATEKRQLALSINAMGANPLDIIRSTAGEGDFESLRAQLQSIQGAIGGMSQKHLAYPMLHYFHSAEAITALPLALARLDQTLSIIIFSNPELPAGTHSQMVTTQRIIDQFLATLRSAFIYPAKQVPPIPALDACAAFPFFHERPRAIRDHLGTLEKQKLLYAYVKDDGWDWSEVWQIEMKR